VNQWIHNTIRFGGRALLAPVAELVRSQSFMRHLLPILLVAHSLCLAANKEAPLTSNELSEFLGPVSPKVIEWTKITGVDWVVYRGRSNPPLNGNVGFYLGGYPDFEPNKKSTHKVGRLGDFPLTWYRTVAADGSLHQEALISLDAYLRVHIWFEGKQQADIDRIVSVVSELPRFKKPTPTGKP